jgi:hypothetical protein
VVADFGRVEADEAHGPAMVDGDRVAIHDVHPLGRDWLRKGRSCGCGDGDGSRNWSKSNHQPIMTEADRSTTRREMTKATKTRAELEALLMAEVRRHPECGQVGAAFITRPTAQNWNFGLLRNGPAIPVECERKVGDYARQLQAQYDLAPE